MSIKRIKKHLGFPYFPQDIALHSEITGKTSPIVKGELLKNLSIRLDHSYDFIEFGILERLCEISTSWNLTSDALEEARWIIKTLQEKLRNIPKNQPAKQEDGSVVDVPVRCLEDMFVCDILKVVLRIITKSHHLPLANALQQESNEWLKLKCASMELLYEMCVEDSKISEKLCEEEFLMHSLLSLLQYNETCLLACDLLDCFLLSRRTEFNLSAVPNIAQLIDNLDTLQFANFCKILAVCLSDLDIYEHKTSLYAQCKEKKRKDSRSYVRNLNQEMILNIPGILSKLVSVACAKPYTPRFPVVSGEMSHWMQWIDNQMERDSESQEAQINFIGGISQYNPEELCFQQESSLKIAAELIFRAYAVNVLGLLLTGKRRKEVQKELVQLKLIPQLSDLFDHFIWKCVIDMDRHRIPGHNSNCECSPEVALKIQVLRLIHSFCEHAEYKHVMLSWSEYSELKRNEKAEGKESVGLDRSVMCTGSKGLLTKVVDVLKKESNGSTFRFWLSRAIESYLRGSTSSADQDFLISKGLLQFVAGIVVNSSTIRQKEVLQSSFDLLGELVKYNIKAFHQLDKVINSKGKLSALTHRIDEYLVDSNMFVRSLLLSFEHFMNSKDDQVRDYSERCNYLLNHIGNQKHRMHYLRKLISLVNVSTLTQENVSCVNTALIIIMFAHQRGELCTYLASLQVPMADSAQTLLQNLLELLLFWQDHYLHKDKDFSALEKSSHISFSRWKAMVCTLVSSDMTSPSSLAYYIHHGSSSRDS